MSSNKTEPPTPKKIRDARKKGQVARSSDLTGAVVLAVVCAGMVPASIWMGRRLTNLTRLMFIQARAFSPRDHFQSVVEHAGWEILHVSWMVLLLAALAAILINFMQIGPLIKKVKPELKHLNPVEGAKSMVKPERFVELLKNAVKICLVFTLTALVIRKTLPWLPCMVTEPLGRLPGIMRETWRQMIVPVIMIFLVIGVADYLYQRKKWWKSLMMTKDEVKREYKEMEGDPQMKSLRSQMQQELAAYRMASEVRDSAVVLVNPVRYAVALKYDDAKIPVPVVAAKGTHRQAKKIVGIARESGVPVLENRCLARSLYTVPVSTEIPEELFEAVAAVIVYVLSIREKGSGDSGS